MKGAVGWIFTTDGVRLAECKQQLGLGPIGFGERNWDKVVQGKRQAILSYFLLLNIVSILFLLLWSVSGQSFVRCMDTGGIDPMTSRMSGECATPQDHAQKFSPFYHLCSMLHNSTTFE